VLGQLNHDKMGGTFSRNELRYEDVNGRIISEDRTCHELGRVREKTAYERADVVGLCEILNCHGGEHEVQSFLRCRAF
jgi:hypothetical protein